MSSAIPRSRSAPGSVTTRGAEIDWTGSSSPASEAARLAEFYDLVYDPLSADADWCRALAARTGGPILELGCGSGRVAVPLATDGHRVVAVDRSPAMLERARARAMRAGVEIELRDGDVRDFSIDETFPLVLMILNTFLMLEPDDRWACLARAREHLARGGRFAIHVFQPDPAKVAGYEGAVVEEGAFETESGSRVTVFTSTRATVDRSTSTWTCDEVGDDRVVRRYSRTSTFHYLYRREAELLLPAAGFSIESMEGDYDGSPADEHSPRLLIVARRRERGDARERRR